MAKRAAERRFEELVRENEAAVRTYAISLASCPCIADDAVQETFVRAWKYLDSFRGEGSFEGWLIRICRRCVVDLEKQRGQHRSFDEGTIEVADRLVEVDAKHEALTLLAKLPIEQREAILLCGVLGYEYADAAQVLDVPIGTVRSRVHRARHNMRAFMAPTHELDAVSGHASSA